MMKSNFAIAVTLILAFVLRIYGMNWDQGFHLHPDERALIMVTERIHLFKQLNPQFFNYGSLPIYILKGLSQIIDTTVSSPISNYSGMLYVGRFLSLFFDLGTIILIYKITLILFSTGSNNNRNKLILLFSSFFYAIAFFPIQNSHFFISDVFLTFFTTLLLYLLIKYLSIPSRHDRIKMVVFLGLAFAAMISTKFTAIIFYPIILLVLIYRKFVDKQLTIQQLAINFIIFNFSLLTFNFLFMPYAFLDYQRFISDITAQIKMNSDPYIFPYTLQYVGTIPYLYYLKNIFLWGLGPFISIFSLIGLFSYLYQISKIKYQKY
ncbi:phospholipid carrier-dependent glycosyltransferase, partial [Candidatus Roizmanbacteria bacterium]|nr:phospholipid carrier-dependent glycosyltransferase [Candidatus Roizmanbacteria bacterium]